MDNHGVMDHLLLEGLIPFFLFFKEDALWNLNMYIQMVMLQVNTN